MALSASAPLVDFSIWICGFGGARLTIWQVAIARSETVAEKPRSVALTGSGWSAGCSGVRKVHWVADGSLTNPGGTPAGSSSVIWKVEFPGTVVVHWNWANPEASVVAVAVLPVPVGGSTQLAGVGVAVAVMSQSAPGTRSFGVFGSGVRSSSLRTVIDGAQSWNAACRIAASRSAKFGTRYTSSVAILKVPVAGEDVGA